MQADPLPYLTFTVSVGYYGGKAAMVLLPKLPESTISHILSHHFLIGQGWKSSELAFPMVFKQEDLAKIYILHTAQVSSI